MTTLTNDILSAGALSLRCLSMDAIQTANSGHPGTPLGLAELGVLLYGEVLRHCPQSPWWENRDRLVLSAGHASMWLYSLLHLSGYEVSLLDINSFRQLGSITPGHPEYGRTAGVEITTGPLGQGISNAVGIALAARMAASRFNTTTHKILNHYTYVVAGDGCLMEGVSSEASSFAGHQGLSRLIVFYDANGITIDGSTDLAFTEDVSARYRAYHWQVLHADAYDASSIRKAITTAKSDEKHPTLIVLSSVIGKGAPTKQGSESTHGSPLGAEEVANAKQAMGVESDEQFFIHPLAREYFTHRAAQWQEDYNYWKALFKEWGERNPGLWEEWKESRNPEVDLTDISIPHYQVGDVVATRKSSGQMLQALTRLLPYLVGGSADLAGSNSTLVPEYTDVGADNPGGKQIRYGVREHAMAAISNGLALYGGFYPYCATFLVFSDYLRPSLRLSALMHISMVYVFTHDSVLLGEDGPTHQPVEHLASLRAIPGLLVLRPGDAEESTEAWVIALRNKGPTCIVLSRQSITVYAKQDPQWRVHMAKGGYVVYQPQEKAEVVVLATGSEVSLACKVAVQSRIPVQVVSVSDLRILQQNPEWYATLVPQEARVVVVEAGIAQGWEGFAKREDMLTIETFGHSGKAEAVAEMLDFTPQVLDQIIHRPQNS